MSEETYHIPALAAQCIEGLNIRPGGTYVDVTFGGGGHSRMIMEHLGPEGRLISLDRDMDAYANRIDDPRFTFVHTDFRYLTNWLRYLGVDKVDGIMADLGVSFHHFDEADRGFSFRADAPLDMRMNRSGGQTAAELLADISRDDLTRILREYGEMKNARRLADAIVKRRDTSPLLTTADLLQTISPLIDPRREKKELAQVFQALRIVVNGEMEALQHLLNSARQALRPGGRLVVLTYHSLEDRMVKNYIRTGSVTGEAETDFFGNRLTPWRAVNRTVITPDAAEVERNPRSRSAKLRIAELTE